MRDLLPLLPWVLGAYLFLVVALPLVRQRVRTGVWAVVVRSSGGSLERLVRLWAALWLVATASFTLLLHVYGPERLLVWEPPAALGWLGVLVLALGLGLTALAQAQMGAAWRIGIDDAPTTLVTAGLYRHVRHPIYTGVLLALVGLCLVAPAPWTLCLALVGYFLVAIQSRLEDEHMLSQHGATYAHWAAQTGRLLPWLGRPKPPKMPV